MATEDQTEMPPKEDEPMEEAPQQPAEAAPAEAAPAEAAPAEEAPAEETAEGQSEKRPAEEAADEASDDDGAKKREYGPVKVLGIGNPILDISANVDDELLKKYELKMGNAILADAEKHLPLYPELQAKDDVEYIAGGSTLNTIRVAQWMSQTQGFGGYIGSIGKDENAEKLKQGCEEVGVQTSFFLSDNPTGTCAVCIKDKERSLIANLSAANDYKQDHIQSAEAQVMTKSARVIYSAGFFLTVSPDTLIEVAQSCVERNAIFAVNLSAEFIVEFFKDKLAAVVEYADFVFGNETEVAKYAAVHSLPDGSATAVAAAIAALPSKRKRPRTVVITQGSQSTCVVQDGKTLTYNVPKLDPEKIVDTNGAGDAFVGGFISQLLLGKKLKTCVDAGHYAAQYIIQTSGTKVEGAPQFAE